MYASDLTLKKRANTIYANLLLQKQYFDQGKSIRIQYQKGGNDYGYMMNLEDARATVKCSSIDTILGTKNGDPTVITPTPGTATMSIGDMTKLDLSLLHDYGYTYTSNPPDNYSLPGTYEDVVVQIPTGGKDFYFFGTNYGALNNIFWNTNSVILFTTPAAVAADNSYYGGPPMIDVPAVIRCPAILIGNYDRRQNSLYTSAYSVSNTYSVIKITSFFQNSYIQTDLIPNTCQMEIRLIRELVGSNRQWIDVRIKKAPSITGYVYGTNVQYDQGWYGNNDTEGNPVDPTKLSPYNITDGTQFYNPCGRTFSTTSPPHGSSFVFAGDSQGRNWTFANNYHVDVP